MGDSVHVHHAPENPFSEAEDDLFWYFQLADGEVGLHAQAYGVAGGGVFDDKASWELHRSKHNPMHRSAVDRRGRIEWALWSLEESDRCNLDLGFRPRQWPWSNDRCALAARDAFKRSGSNVCLLALALTTREVRQAFADREWSNLCTWHRVRADEGPMLAGPPPSELAIDRAVRIPGVEHLLRFLEWEAELLPSDEAQAGSARKKSAIVARINAAAEAKLLGPLDRFQAKSHLVKGMLRQERRESRRRRLEGMLDALRGGRSNMRGGTVRG